MAAIWTDPVVRYDAVIMHPKVREEYGDAAYYNVGDWSDVTARGGAQAAASRALVARHVELAGLDRPSLKVADVGCGLGQSTADIAEARADASVVGINNSHAQIAEAKQRFPELAFAVMDAARPAFARTSLDCIIAVEAAFHFSPRTAFLAAAAEALKPGGLLVYSDVLFAPGSEPWDWWVPARNRDLALAGYPEMLAGCGLTLANLDDVTATTWTPYCANLRATGRESADRIEPWVAHYLIVVATPSR